MPITRYEVKVLLNDLFVLYYHALAAEMRPKHIDAIKEAQAALEQAIDNNNNYIDEEFTKLFQKIELEYLTLKNTLTNSEKPDDLYVRIYNIKKQLYEYCCCNPRKKLKHDPEQKMVTFSPIIKEHKYNVDKPVHKDKPPDTNNSLKQ